MGAVRFFVFLRAINTGSRRLTNDELLAPFRSLGLGSVAAYQAAGNVTFLAQDAAEVSTDVLDRALADAYGFEAPCFLRSAADLDRIAAARPFSEAELAATAGRVQVTLLRREPDRAAIEQVHAFVPAEDRIVIDGREWYWLPVDGVSGSQLPVAAIEQQLGTMTMRTQGTLARFAAKFRPERDG